MVVLDIDSRRVRRLGMEIGFRRGEAGRASILTLRSSRCSRKTRGRRLGVRREGAAGSGGGRRQ